METYTFLCALLVCSVIREALHLPRYVSRCTSYCMGDVCTSSVVMVTLSEAVLCCLAGRDVVDIAQVLADVPDWKGLASWLNIRSNDIETDCALQGVAQASCYRRELVRRYCDRQPSESPYKVAEDIAEVLEQMGHERQAQRLTKLEFGKSVSVKCSSQPYQERIVT